jgi:hypothetical protein
MATISSRPPIAFAAPAQQELLRAYGDPRTQDWERCWMTLWNISEEFAWFPKPAIYLHKDFKALLQKAFNALEQQDLHLEIRTCDGCFNIRHVRGSYSVLSVHSWGAAIDLNARDNPLGTSGRWSPEFLEIMNRCGIYCGQQWIGRKDPMHFAMVNG